MHSLYKPRKKKILRRPIVSRGIFNLLVCDLADFSKFSTHNAGKKWLFVGTCATSRYTFLRALKEKSKILVGQVFKDIIDLVKKMGYTIDLVWTDRGVEFSSSRGLLEAHGIQWYYVNTPLKCSLAENYIKLICQRFYRIMAYYKTFDWSKYVQQVQNAFNDTVPLGAVYSPREIVENKDIGKKVMRQNALKLKKKYEFIEKKEKLQSKIAVGDLVRVLKPLKNIFQKGTYEPQFSDKIHVVEKIIDTIPKMFKVSEIPQRNFYYDELSPLKNIDETVKELQKPSFILIKTQNVGGRSLRSGSKTNQETEYLVQGIYSRDVRKWVKSADYENMVKNGLILPKGSD